MKNKHLIIVAIALMAMLCGCEQIKNAPPESSIMQDAEEVKTIEYQGHSYVCYRFYCKSGYSGWGGASIVHDPDCKCGKEK
ncbi:MAG: hypothetical protein NC421_07440 [Lachnospiraceae bacterium]|nr:hypothetical protein [Lachnospiraceae bacterium]